MGKTVDSVVRSRDENFKAELWNTQGLVRS